MITWLPLMMIWESRKTTGFSGPAIVQVSILKDKIILECLPVAVVIPVLAFMSALNSEHVVDPAGQFFVV